MKCKAAVVTFFTIFMFICCSFSAPQNLIMNIHFKKNPSTLRALDNKSDATDNITCAENLIFANFEILLGTELNDGEVWYLYLCLGTAINYLNIAEHEFSNDNYTNAIMNALKSQSISQGILPISLIKGVETVLDKEFMTFMLPFIILIITISIILGITSIYFVIKYYQKKKNKKALMKKKIISE